MKNRPIFLWIALLVAFLLHIACVAIARDNIDVRNFEVVGHTLTQGGVFALYTHTAGKYPYPPLWAGFILLSLWISKVSSITFSWAIRVPGMLSDLGIVYLCWRWWYPRDISQSWFVSFLYAISPVPLLITCLHGQFDALPTFLMMSAFLLYLRNRWVLSAIALGFGIAAKPFPVLMLPWLVWHLPDIRKRIEYALIAALPTVVLLAPFMVYSPTAVVNQVFGYAGVPLLGFLTPLRSFYVLFYHKHFPVPLTHALMVSSKWLFLASYLLWLVLSEQRHLSLVQWAVGVWMLFYGIYAGISPQYLLWAYPLLLWLRDQSRVWSIGYTITATLALIGFYEYAVPTTVHAVWLGNSASARALYGAAGTLWWGSVLLLLIWVLHLQTN